MERSINSEWDKKDFYFGDGTYLTYPQHSFLQNIMDSEKPYTTKEYISYLDLCRIYNEVSYIYEEDKRSCYFYWDDETETLSFSYPKEGRVSKVVGGIRRFSSMLGI